MILKPQGPETNLLVASNVGGAKVVRLFNSSTGSQLVTNSNGSTFTMPAGSISFVEKLPEETLTGAITTLAVSIAYKS